jgi:hypothetical protein
VDGNVCGNSSSDSVTVGEMSAMQGDTNVLTSLFCACSCFSQDDIAAAKRLLIQEFQSMTGVSQFTTECRNSPARLVHKAENEDIIAILDIADTKSALIPIIHYFSYNVNYTYNFNMSRFSILDHFILSSLLYNGCIAHVSVSQDIDNLSYHEPLMLQLNIDVTSSMLHS